MDQVSPGLGHAYMQLYGLWRSPHGKAPVFIALAVVPFHTHLIITPVIIAIIIWVYVSEDPGQRAPILDILPAALAADRGQVL